MSNEPMTIQEIVSMLKRSNIPTIVVEGKDDIIVWREVEKILYDKRVSIVQTWGRNNLLSVFDEMRGYTARVPILYVADKDDWSFLGVPKQYEEIIFTHGYSIENDMIYDANLLEMVQPAPRRYEQELKYIIEYYSLFLISKIICFEKNKFKISDHINKIVMSGKVERFKNNFLDFYEFSYPVMSIIKEDYINLMRGKSLIEIICKYSHNGINPPNLLKVAAIQRGKRMKEICSKINSSIDIYYGENSI